jgi:cyclophilin family peptidyl-prolyl cis-trans isomerase
MIQGGGSQELVLYWYAFKDEFTDLKFNKGGILAMANLVPLLIQVNFFITHKDTNAMY